jgi:hypothetical protein
VSAVPKLLAKLAPEGRFYLTNIHADGLKPSAVRDWAEDLWLFPYVRDSGHVPHDVASGMISSEDWPERPFNWGTWFFSWGWIIPAALLIALLALNTCRRVHRRRVSPPTLGNG